MYNPNESGLLVPYDISKARDKKNVVTAIQLPNGNQEEVVIPWWVTSPEQELEKKRLLAGQFFLLKQGSLGEVFRCNRCKGKHKYFTLMCIERPFSGLTQGLHAYWHHAGKYGAENYLSEVELQRYEAIKGLMAKSRPDLASSHPETARSFKTDERDYDVGALALGLLEPITKAKAAALVWNINLHANSVVLTLPGLEAD